MPDAAHGPVRGPSEATAAQATGPASPSPHALRAEASMRVLAVHVQILQDRLHLARSPVSAVCADGVPADLLTHVALAAEALEQRIARVLERIDPGLGRDTAALAALLREHLPPPAASPRAAASRLGGPGRDAASD